MSNTEIFNEKTFRATYKEAGLEGEMVINDRVDTRGKEGRGSLRKHETFQAFFSFDEPMFVDLDQVPVDGGYFTTEDGRAEVTQLIGRFETPSERDRWLSSRFSYDEPNAA